MVRVIIDNELHISRITAEYNSKLYRGYLLQDIEISQDLNSGFIEVNWGEIEVSIIAFSKNVTLRTKSIVDIKIYHNDILLFDGKGEKSVGANSFIYTLYSNQPFQDNILFETSEENVIPISFGTVAHYRPLIKDEATYTYYLPSILTVNDVSDDGVGGVSYSIDTDGNIALDNAPIGEITFNVTSLYTTVAEIISYLVGETVSSENMYNDEINAIVDSQYTKMDYIKILLEYTSNMAYMDNGLIKVFKKDYFDNSLKVDNFNIKPIKNSLSSSISKTYSKLKATYITSNAVFKNNAYSLEDKTEDIESVGENTYADEIVFSVIETNTTDGVNPYNKIKGLLDRYANFLNNEEIEVQVVEILSINAPTSVTIETVSKSGNMIVTGITHNIGKTLTTTLRGYGNVDFKQV